MILVRATPSDPGAAALFTILSSLISVADNVTRRDVSASVTVRDLTFRYIVGYIYRGARR